MSMRSRSCARPPGPETINGEKATRNPESKQRRSNWSPLRLDWQPETSFRQFTIQRRKELLGIIPGDLFDGTVWTFE
jgi:hypothetical protein